MKICFITNSLAFMGGVERILSVLASELSKDNEVTILCTDRKGFEKGSYYSLDPKVTVDCFKDLRLQKTAYFFRKVIRKINAFNRIKNQTILQTAYFPEKESQKYIVALDGRFDVIIGVQDIYVLQLAVIADRISGRCYGWIHNSYGAIFETPNCYSWHRERLYEANIQKLDGCVVLTDRDQAKFMQLAGDYFVRIYNPAFCPATEQNATDKKDIDILWVGRLVKEQKGLDYLVSILEQVQKKIQGVRCSVVGDGAGKSDLETEIERRRLQECIHLEGSTTDVAQYYKRSKILINTSRWEGFGLVITEALANSVPVVAFSTNGPSEIIRDGQDGFLVDCFDVNMFADKIWMLLKNSQLRAQMSNNAAIRARDFSLATIRAQWMELLKGKRE